MGKGRLRREEDEGRVGERREGGKVVELVEAGRIGKSAVEVEAKSDLSDEKAAMSSAWSYAGGSVDGHLEPVESRTASSSSSTVVLARFLLCRRPAQQHPHIAIPRRVVRSGHHRRGVRYSTALRTAGRTRRNHAQRQPT